MKKFDISAILIGHKEGWMIYPSIVSMLQAIKHAENHGLEVEMLVVLDRADKITEEFIQHNCPSNTYIECINKGDLSEARNYAVTLANGNFIAFLDGDDLWSKNWLTEAYRICNSSESSLICHPDVNIFFGESDLLLFRLGMNDPDFDINFLNYTNCWSALSFSRIETYYKHPYVPANFNAGFGYEDWHWNCETVNAGIPHIIAKGTTHFYRRKPYNSLEQNTQFANCLMTPSNLFLNTTIL